MSATLKKVENNIAELTIEVESSVFEQGLQQAFVKNQKHFSLPGFRKGKVPRAMVEKAYGADVLYEDAINFVFPDAYDKAIEELSIDPVSRPEVDVEQVGKGQNLILTVKTTLKPEVKLGTYKGIKIEKADDTVSDDQVAAELEKLREKGTRIITVDDRAVAHNDIANIDFEGFKDGVAFEGGAGQNFDLTIGSGQFIPGFEEQLIGKNIGEETTVALSFPEDYHAEDLKGAPVEFKVKINGIQVKELPALDDEFAKDVSESDTLDDLKKEILDNLTTQAKNRAKAEQENKALEAVADNTQADIPQCMIDTQVEQMLRDYDMRMSQQGFSLQQYLEMTGGNLESFKEQFTEQAAKQVKINLTLEAIGKAEGFTATEEEIEAEFAQLAETYKMPLEEIKKYLPAADVGKDIVTKKAVDVIVSNAKVK